MADAPTYRAFLSYSHADARLAERLHRRWESFRVDKDLTERTGALGPVPASLRPIFRDRGDFKPGGSLTEATRAALDASAVLVVLASPAAAASRFVDAEVRLFRDTHPDRPVVPLILSGAPGSETAECFSPS